VGCYNVWVNNYVAPFRQNVVSPSDGWLSLVHLAAEVNGRRKRCKLCCRFARMVSDPRLQRKGFGCILTNFLLTIHTLLPHSFSTSTWNFSFILTINQACSSETSEQAYHSSRCYNSEGYNFNNSCSEILKYYTNPMWYFQRYPISVSIFASQTPGQAQR
jgi:hypothetical protein